MRGEPFSTRRLPALGLNPKGAAERIVYESILPFGISPAFKGSGFRRLHYPHS
jgi:hypothetical protein